MNKKDCKTNCKRHTHFTKHFRNTHDLERFHTRFKFFRPFALTGNLLILILLISWQGINGITIAFAFLFIIRDTFQLFLMLGMQKRIIEPVKTLKSGIESVSAGNYDIQLSTDLNNEFKDILDDFNQMIVRLKETESIKRNYEENRKHLVANITHDIKTPLTSILGYMETINEGVITDEATIKKYNEIVLNNVRYTNKLIDDLFLFSKLDLEQVPFDFKNTNARQYFADLMEEIQFEVEETGYTWAFNNHLDTDSLIYIDGKRIYQSVRNLIGNAIKYGASEDLMITASTYENEDSCVISIKDNGPGIEKDKIPYIFDRFYRTDKARTKDTMSTGLGLSITREFIEAHQGTIWVNSELATGTEILFKLPLILNNQEDNNETHSNH